VDKAKSENQVIHGHKQECGYDSNMDSDVRLLTHCLLEIHLESKTIHAANYQSTSDEFVCKVVDSQSHSWALNRENTGESRSASFI